MADISKVKVPNVSTPYNIKDANAGYSVALDSQDLLLKNAAGSEISRVTLPGGNTEIYQFTLKDYLLASISPFIPRIHTTNGDVRILVGANKITSLTDKNGKVLLDRVHNDYESLIERISSAAPNATRTPDGETAYIKNMTDVGKYKIGFISTQLNSILPTNSDWTDGYIHQIVQNGSVILPIANITPNNLKSGAVCYVPSSWVVPSTTADWNFCIHFPGSERIEPADSRNSSYTHTFKRTPRIMTIEKDLNTGKVTFYVLNGDTVNYVSIFSLLPGGDGTTNRVDNFNYSRENYTYNNFTYSKFEFDTNNTVLTDPVYYTIKFSSDDGFEIYTGATKQFFWNDLV